MAVDYTFQSKVELYPGIGVPGAHASINPLESTPLGFTAADTVAIGGFVWEYGSDQQVKSTGSGAPLGFAVREITNVLNPGTAYANTVPAGFPVSVAVEGDFFVQPAASVTKGQKVFASTTTGAVSGASAGATVAGSVETNWAFATSCGAGEIAIITNHGQTPVVAPTDLSDYLKSADAATTYSTIANTVTAVAAGDNSYELKVTKNGTDSVVEVPHA